MIGEVQLRRSMTTKGPKKKTLPQNSCIIIFDYVHSSVNLIPRGCLCIFVSSHLPDNLPDSPCLHLSLVHVSTLYEAQHSLLPSPRSSSAYTPLPASVSIWPRAPLKTRVEEKGEGEISQILFMASISKSSRCREPRE